MQKTSQTTNPHFSIVIPTYNAEKFIERAVASLTCQAFEDFEVVVVDDASTDSTVGVLQRLAANDLRVRYFVQSRNKGTLAARAKGVAEARGNYILLMDQDDELTEDALEKLYPLVEKADADIVHFGVKVVPENEEAKQAAMGYEEWINPEPRRLECENILGNQFCDYSNFDWQIHHKVFKANLAKKAWRVYSHQRLCTADDFLVSYILCSYAKSYVALNDCKWYKYHLGAGETFGSDYTIDSWRRICEVDVKAYRLVSKFERRHGSNREQVLQNCQSKLVENVMNEFHDNLGPEYVNYCVEYALKFWQPGFVAYELWRFVRDRAYEDLVNKADYKNDEILDNLLELVKKVDGQLEEFDSERYSLMKKDANIHLKELEKLSFVDQD